MYFYPMKNSNAIDIKKIILPDYSMILIRQNFKCGKIEQEKGEKRSSFVFHYILISTNPYVTVVDKRHSILLKTINCVMLVEITVHATICINTICKIC